MAQVISLKMYVTLMLPVLQPTCRQLAVFGILLVASVALAQTVDRPGFRLTYDDIVAQEIFDSTGAWRESPVTDDEWRAAQKQDSDRSKSKSKFKFGYDSAYEEMRSRKNYDYRTDHFDIGEVKPNTVFRFNF